MYYCLIDKRGIISNPRVLEFYLNKKLNKNLIILNLNILIEF